MPKEASARADVGVPPEDVLRTLRIPFVRKAMLVHGGKTREVFTIDLGLSGVFIEQPEPLPVGDTAEITLPWSGSEIPVKARCRVAWWHAREKPLKSKALPAGAGLQFVEMTEADRVRVREQLVEHCRQHPRVRHFLRHWPRDEQGDDP